MDQQKKLLLTNLSQKELSKREQLNFRGGVMATPGCCNCGCCGPSSDIDNFNANYAAGYTETCHGGSFLTACDGNCIAEEIV